MRPNPNHTVLYTAVVTPFTNEGTVAYAEFESLLRTQEKAGNGVVVLGSTGEGLALADEEKRELVRFTAALGLKVPVLVGVGGSQLPQTLDFLRFTENQAIDGYLMPVPLYAKPGLEGQTEWFTALLEAVNRPCMIYNVPSRAGVKLHPEALRRLSAHRNAWSVKEASGSVEEFRAYRAAAPQMAFYSGDDALMPEFASEGAVGLVSVASNAWPVETQRFVRLCLEGKSETCATLWKFASDSLFTASNPVPVKALMALQGQISRAHTRAPLSLKDLKNTEGLEQSDAAVKSWYASL